MQTWHSEIEPDGTLPPDGDPLAGSRLRMFLVSIAGADDYKHTCGIAQLQ
jgi:hypothetical protein